MFHCLHYSGTFNESKEKFRIVFCCFSAIKNILAPSSSSNFSITFIEENLYLLVLVNLCQQVYNNFDGTNNLICFPVV